jgi:hypothetical protein
VTETSHDHDHDHEGDLHHTHFLSVSLVNARVCTGCGGYVDGNRLEAHAAFHKALIEIVDLLEAGQLPQPMGGKKTAARRSPAKKAASTG